MIDQYHYQRITALHYVDFDLCFYFFARSRFFCCSISTGAERPDPRPDPRSVCRCEMPSVELLIYCHKRWKLLQKLHHYRLKIILCAFVNIPIYTLYICDPVLLQLQQLISFSTYRTGLCERWGILRRGQYNSIKCH